MNAKVTMDNGIIYEIVPDFDSIEDLRKIKISEFSIVTLKDKRHVLLNNSHVVSIQFDQ
jgi:hypothetical protein